MASQGPLSAGTGANDASIGTTAWTNAGNITASDDTYATCVVGASFSQYLVATNFGFSIPSGATIDGIVAEVERKSSAGGANDKDTNVFIVKGGVFGSTNKALAGAWPTSDAYASYGSPSDLWGETWTPAAINASNFGLAFLCRGGAGGTVASVDHIRITVHYTGGATAQIVMMP